MQIFAIVGHRFSANVPALIRQSTQRNRSDEPTQVMHASWAGLLVGDMEDIKGALSCLQDYSPNKNDYVT
eukprot:6472865-Amphidinium_carterae.1